MTDLTFSAATMRSIEQHVNAIALCLRSGLPGPALVLTYVGIDAFGALGRPVGQKRNVKADFVAWANRYMVKPKRLPVTALELYGARCGMLHTLGAESDLSATGKVRSVMYSWGGRDIDPANAIVAWAAKQKPRLDAVVVKAEDITDAFVEGIALFGRDVDSDPDFQSEVEARTRKMFGQFDQFPGTPGFVP
jgi:hypothetical protein